LGHDGDMSAAQDPSSANAVAAAIAALEAQRPLLGDAVVDAALAPLRARWLALQQSSTGPAAAPAAAASALQGAQTRRQVSVLFLDVVGSTTLAQHLDPEEVHEIMDGALQRFSRIVEQHGGKVLQYAGDSMLCAFGAEQAAEDDAERAVRAGLALIEASHAEAAAVQARHGHSGFGVRVGVHTGSVLLGGGVDAEGSIRGMTVNVAARMEQTAPPGSLRISRDSWRHVRGLFELEEQAPIQVKGRDEPIVTYLVLGPAAKAFRPGTRGIEGLDTPMLGRDAEWKRLCEAFDQARQGSGPVALSLLAEAGLGKTRLLAEFEAWLLAQTPAPALWRARAVPHSQQQPYAMLRELLAQEFGIGDGDTAAAAAQRFEAAVLQRLPGPDAQAQAHLLGHLIGLDFSASPHVQGLWDDERQRRARAFRCAHQLLRGSAAAQAPVLLLEDMHWADEGSLDFFSQWASQPTSWGLLLVAARPQLLERRPNWLDDAPAAQRIQLQAFSADTATALAARLLAPLGEVPAALRDLIAQRGQGNPFYMEELVKMLIDDGAIVVEHISAFDSRQQQWRLVPERLLNTRVPGTLVGVLQARLDRLPPLQRQVLQEASVLGLVFWDAALAALDGQSLPWLAPLGQQGMVQRSGLVDESQHIRAWAFSHALLHEVTYDTVLKRLRRELHERAARFLSQLDSARANDCLALAAHHFAQAEQPALAAEYHLRAAEQALSRFAQSIALEQAQHCLRLGAGLPSEEAKEWHWRALLVRQRALRLLGRRPEALADAQGLRAHAQAAGRGDWLAVGSGREAAMQESAKPSQALALAQEAVALAQAHALPRVEVAAHITAAGALRRLGQHEQALQAVALGISCAQANANRRGETELLVTRAAIFSELQRLPQAIEGFEQGIAGARAIGDRNTECGACINLADALLRLGDAEQARAQLEQALALIEETGLLHLRAAAVLNLGAAQLLAGRAQPALALAEQALAEAQEAHDELTMAYAHMAAAHALLALGEAPALAHALARYEQAAQTMLRQGLPHLACEAQAGAAFAAAQSAQPELAATLAEAVWAQAQHNPGFEGCEQPLRVRWMLGRSWQVLGDARAEAWLEQAREALLASAGQITEGHWRTRYLQAVPWNRALLSGA
jgi:class 3 adenylate cyclase/predicted ATPase